MVNFTRLNDDRIEFLIWAPKLKSIDVVDEGGRTLVSLHRNKKGEFEGELDSAGSVFRQSLKYFFLIDGHHKLPDPCSVFLPDDVHGPSEIPVGEFDWTDDQWCGIDKADLTIYELHLGTFSDDGTYEGCRQQLDYLCDLGVSAIELLPLAQCPGRWNWGYDGVGLFAPSSKYGTINDLKRLIDDCHGRGLSVIHDVVYNHVGPEGNYLGAYAKYFSRKHGTPWGSAFDFDGPNRKRARSLVIENALFWLNEFHFDGLRLDAIHFMFDDSEYSIQQEICDRVCDFEREAGRKVHLIGEANIYDHRLIVDGGEDRNTYGAIWADDLMHAVYSIADAGEHLTPRTYAGGSDVEEALQNGYLYEGPVMKRVGEADRDQTHGEGRANREYLSSLIIALQTHDSVGNHPQGKRLHHLVGAEFQKAAAPLFWLYPAIPMMFMGEEFAAESPFMFFADFLEEKLRRSVNRGRMKEYPHHDWSDSIQPCDERAFFDCKLKLPPEDNYMLVWYRELIALRKQWRQIGLLNAKNLNVSCEVDSGIFSLRYQNGDRQAFVVSRLGCGEAPGRPYTLKCSAQVLLDSSDAGVTNESRRQESAAVQISENQSIIGLGAIEF